MTRSLVHRSGLAQQRWYCESCDNGGSVPYEDHADVYSVRNLIESAHGAASPGCAARTGIAFVRVVIPGDGELAT